MSVSLKDLADSQFGNSGTVRLTELRENGFTRTYAGSGYYRVNPFEVHNGNAQHPTSSANHSLIAWDGYSVATINQATDLDCTSVTSDAATFDWTLPSGYVLDNGSLRQRVCYAECAGPNPADCPGANPFTDASRICFETAVGDAATYTRNSLTDDTWYVFGFETTWDRDGDGSYVIPATTGSAPHIAKDNVNITDASAFAASTGGDKIWLQTDTTTTTTTTTATCAVDSLGYDLISSAGACAATPSTYYWENAGPAIGDTIYSNSSCTSTSADGYYSDGTTWYRQSGGSVISDGSC